MHPNIRNLLPELDYVKIWAMQTYPDILVLTETWISGDILDYDINNKGYYVFRADFFLATTLSISLLPR